VDVVRMESTWPSASVSGEEDDDGDDDDGALFVCDDVVVGGSFAVMGSTSSARDSATIRWAVEKNLNPGGLAGCWW